MSLYDHAVIGQREAAGHQVSNAFRSLTEEEGMKRVHARDLEMHMKSKKQLYTCLTLEGKQATLHILILCLLLTSDPL